MQRTHAGPPTNEGRPCAGMVREYLKEIPCIRWEKVSDMRKLMASGQWAPQSDSLVERILAEHLLDPLQP
jgi:hypothetical protein